MPEGGHLVFRVCNMSQSQTFAIWEGNGLPGEYVSLAVIDNGCGMSMVFGLVKQSNG